MAFYETPRRNASDGSGASNRSTNRGHRREHSDPCPLPSPGLPHKALSTPELLRSKTVGDPCSAIRRSCSSLAALRGLTPEPVPPNADGFEELREGDEFLRTSPPAGDGRGRRLHWSLRAHHLFHGSVQREMYLSGHGSRQARREAARKNNNVQAVLRQEKHKQLQDTFD